MNNSAATSEQKRIFCESPIAAGRHAAWLHLKGIAAVVVDENWVLTFSGAPTPAYHEGYGHDLNWVHYWIADGTLPGTYIVEDGTTSPIQVVRDESGNPWVTDNRREAIARCNQLNLADQKRYAEWLASDCAPTCESDGGEAR